MQVHTSFPGVTELGFSGMHTYPFSIWQIAEHPSPSLILLSSHYSLSSLIPFPHLEVHMVPEREYPITQEEHTVADVHA